MSSAAHRRTASGSAGVIVGAAVLVLAVWGSLLLSARGGTRAAAPEPPGGALPSALDGYRADLGYRPDDSTLGFVEIPGGPFTMGSDPRVDPMAFEIERWSRERLQGVVELPTFRLARTEVTVAQYAAFVRDAGHPVVDARALDAPPDRPVAFVSWTDALAYARWLDATLRARRDALPPALGRLVASGWTVTLPSEAQWEKAARGGDGRIWPWGGEPRADRARFGTGSTAPVGSFPCPECPFPLADMAGNVWEWTRSPFQPYPWTESDDEETLDAEALWVMRGGSFGDPPQHVRAANRGGADPGARRAFIGFRVALTPP